MAIKRKAVPLLALLIEWRADLELQSMPGAMHPLHLAAQINCFDTTTLLLDARADPLAKNANGQVPAAIAKWGRVKTLLFETMVASNRCYSSVRLVNAAKAAQADGIRSLLATKADPNSFDGKVTALHACVESGHAGGDAIGAARLLLESGALPDLVYPAVGHGRTALARRHRAAKWSSLRSR